MVGTGAEHLAQMVIARAAQVEVMRDRGDHQTAIQTTAADAFYRPDPLCQRWLEERAAATCETVFVSDHGPGV